jgi:flavin-dependent dehydrogenase
VTLLEAKLYPHHKVCGEFLSPECAVLLDELDFTTKLRALQPVMIETVCISAGKAVWESPLPGRALGVSRYRLDSSLAAHARESGVDLRDATTVTAVRGDLEAGFQLDMRLVSGKGQVRARTVIGAYGKRAILDRSLNRAFLRQNQPFVGLKRHFYGRRLPGRIELHGFTGGYCGMSEIEDGKTNICLLVRESVFRQAGNGSITSFVEWMQVQNPRLGRWLAAARPAMPHWLSISQVPFVDKQVVESDILMTGDAAGLIAPLAGDGMAMAIQGGKLAAEHVTEFLSGQRNADELRMGYAADWQREFSARLRLGRALQTIMMKPGWLAVGLRLTRNAPFLGQYLMTHTRDTRPASMRRIL